MAENHDDLLSGGGTGALPRFLSNMEPAQDAVSDSPVGGAPWTTARALMAGATGFAAMMSSAFLAPEPQVQRAGMTASGLRVDALRVETVQVTPLHVGNITSPSVTGIVADDERLAFAANLGEHLETLSRLQNFERVAVSPLAPQAPIEDAVPLDVLSPEAEVASLLIVRNLPEGATFSDGVAAGLGAWAIGGQDPAQIVAAIDGGFEQAVTAQVDFIASSGATLETRAIDLPAKVKGSAADARPWQAANAAPQIAKLGPKRRAAAFKRKATLKLAEQSIQKPKRRKRKSDDAYRAQAQKVDSNIETGTAGVQGEPAEEPGVLSKFFSMFKGNSGSASSAPPATAAKEAAREYDGSLRGLGMSPPD